MIPFRENKIEIDGSDYRKVIKGNAAQFFVDDYETKVKAILDVIYGDPPWVGTLLIDEITERTGDRKVVITPYGDELKIKQFDNAAAKPLSLKDATPTGERAFAGKSDDPRTKKDERFDLTRDVGTGLGSNVRIYFTPMDLPEVGTFGKCGEAVDDLLLHELVHALRQMQHKWLMAPSEDPHYDNQEEWLAIMVTNIYMAEKADWPLRADHWGYNPLAHHLDTSKKFMLDAKNLHQMMTLFDQHTKLFSEMADRALARPENLSTGLEDLSEGLPELFHPQKEFNPLKLYRDHKQEFIKKMIDEQLNWLKSVNTGPPASQWGGPSKDSNPDMWKPKFGERPF